MTEHASPLVVFQRSIRHNLSLKAMFIRKERASNPGKGYYWVLNVRMGEGNKRDCKRSDPRSDPPWRDDDDYSKASDILRRTTQPANAKSTAFNAVDS